jgi:hypothetical protein
MTPIHGTPRLMPAFLLAVLLVGAQLSVTVHAFEHDPGAPQGKVCSTCATAAQLGAASVDHPAAEGPQGTSIPHRPVAVITRTGLDIPVACQRGPPDLL